MTSFGLPAHTLAAFNLWAFGTCCQGHIPPLAWNLHHFLFPSCRVYSKSTFQLRYFCGKIPYGKLNLFFFIFVCQIFLVFLVFCLLYLYHYMTYAMYSVSLNRHATCKWLLPYNFSTYQMTHCKGTINLWKEMKKRKRIWRNWKRIRISSYGSMGGSRHLFQDKQALLVPWALRWQEAWTRLRALDRRELLFQI